MNRPANALRGEASLTIGGTSFLLRPSFEALVAAEDELGSLFAMVDRAAQGSLALGEMASLLWHCLPPEGRPPREQVGEALLAMGMIEAARPLRTILTQIIRGRG